MYALLLLQAPKFGCLAEALDIVALLSVENVFFMPKNEDSKARQARKRFIAFEGDHLTLLNALRGFRQSHCDPLWAKKNFLNYKALQKALVRGKAKQAQRASQACLLPQ